MERVERGFVGLVVGDIVVYGVVDEMGGGFLVCGWEGWGFWVGWCVCDYEDASCCSVRGGLAIVVVL